MTDYFLYETLTWPEVAGLPRHTPLLLPLGGGYSLEQVSSALGNPPLAGLLPAIPFGWRGSGLFVPEAVLGKLVTNLLDSLRDDGFSQVFALTPPGIDLGMGELGGYLPSRISLPGEYSLSRPAARLPAEAERGKVILLPIGHTEQHGYHLALNTDSCIIDAVSQGTMEAAPTLAYSLPVFPYGVSTHRASFAGTLNVGGRAFEDFWLALVEALAERGFDRFYLLSGHGGNMSFLVNVVKYAGERYPHIFCATSFLYLSGPAGVAALERHRQSPLGGMGHACELETSLMLHRRPELVHMEKVVDETEFITTPSYYMDWVEGGALIANPPWTDDTATGAYGAGSLASAEKGALWLRAAVEEKVGHVQEIHEQFSRRKQKREGQ